MADRHARLADVLTAMGSAGSGPPRQLPLTVAIPAWEGARFLGEAIASVLAQSFADFELLVVDDASSDDSPGIAGSFADPRLRCLRNPRRLGLVGNWNRCLAEARGRYVTVFHQDDRMAPDNLARKVALLDAHPRVGFVYSDVRQIGPAGETIADHWWARTAAAAPVRDGREFFVEELIGANLVCAPSVMLRRELVERLGGFDPELPFTADWEMWLRLALEGDVAYLDEPLVDYRRHAGMETAHFLGARGLAEELAAKRRALERQGGRIDDAGRLRVELHVRVVEEAGTRAAAAHLAGEDAEALSLFEFAADANARAVHEAGTGYSERMLAALAPASARAAAGLLRRPAPRVVALVAAYNEADVIGPVIGALAGQGIEVYLIDHRSTDRTVEIARGFEGRGLVGLESFPPAGEPDDFAWRRILERKEELAATLDADWFIHHDADEFRESPWPGIGLREGIGLVDRLGYDAIDFALFNFWPSDDSFRPGDDPRTRLRRYLPGEAFDGVQIKCWKKPRAARVDLASAGGHDVRFPGRRVFPIRFVLRHYPLRSAEHARRKVHEERLPRFDARERALGWHVQYDALGGDVVRPAESLRAWDGDAVAIGLQIENRELEHERARAAELERALDERSQALAELERDAAGLASALADRERELAVLARRLDASEVAGGAAAAELARCATELDRIRDELGSIVDSRSWRLTAPLRRAAELWRGSR